MENVYEPIDFEQYYDFFSSKCYCIKEFINKLNLIIQNENIVCDIIIILKKLKNILPDNIFNYICNYFNVKDGCYSMYILFKIILENKYELIDNYIIPISNITNRKYNNDYTNKNNIEITYKLIGYIYDYINEDDLYNLVDVLDVNNQYQTLNIKNIDLIDSHQLNQYLTISNLHIIQKFNHNYYRIKFIYKLVYYISKETNTNEKNARDDFFKRFEYHIDDFIRMYNYIEVLYYEDNYKNNNIRKVEEIPCAYILKIYHTNINNYKNGVIKSFDMQDIILTNELKYLYVNDLIYCLIYSIHNVFEDKFKLYCKYVLKYDNISDIYHFEKYLHNNMFVIGEKLQYNFLQQFKFVRCVKYMKDILDCYNESLHDKQEFINTKCEFKLFLDNLIEQFKHKSSLEDYYLVRDIRFF